LRPFRFPEKRSKNPAFVICDNTPLAQGWRNHLTEVEEKEDRGIIYGPGTVARLIRHH
jgi:hypothetical protein